MRVSDLLNGLLAIITFAASTRAAPSTEASKRTSGNTTVEKFPHVYAFTEFAPGGGSFEQPYFRFLILFRMKPNATEEEVNEHWKTVHADLTMTLNDVGADILRYVQGSAPDLSSRVFLTFCSFIS